MWHPDNSPEIASHRIGSLLVGTLVPIAILLASAVSGATVALHLANAVPSREHRSLPISAATPAPVLAPSMDESPVVTGELPSTLQASHAAARANLPAGSATRLAPWVPTGAAPSSAERELTFASGYAQRHPEALARAAEPHITPPPASGPAPRGERLSKREVRRASERQRASVLHRETVGIAASGFFANVEGDAHQAPSYTDPRNVNGSRALGRAQSSPSARHRGVSSVPRV